LALFHFPRAAYADGVPGLEAHEQLSQLIADVYELMRRVQGDATPEEVSLRVKSAKQRLDELAETIGIGASGAFGTLARHLSFLDYWYQRDKPNSYSSDLIEMTERDLPGVAAAVSAWARSGLDPALGKAIATSWNSRHYSGAVRDAFIHLESVLRDAGGTDPARGLSGERLIEELLGANSATPLPLPADGPFGALTSGERAGAYHLLRGAFLLARNATAHRPIEYTRQQAEDLLHLVNLCLNVVQDRAPPPA
jgi:hypothetical protein